MTRKKDYPRAWLVTPSQSTLYAQPILILLITINIHFNCLSWLASILCSLLALYKTDTSRDSTLCEYFDKSSSEVLIEDRVYDLNIED